MTDWLKRARLKFSQVHQQNTAVTVGRASSLFQPSPQPTAITDERNLMSVTAVSIAGFYEKKESPADATEGRVIAYLIASEVLGCDIWFAFDDSFETHDGLAVFYADELLFLKDKGPETLREIHKTKMKFPGSR